MGCVRTSTGARARHCHPHHAGHFSVTTSTGAHTREASKSPQQKPARSRQGDGKGAGGQRTDAISLSILSTASSSITVFAVIDRIAVASLVPSSAKTMVASCHKACNTTRVEVLFWRPDSVQGCLPNGGPSNPTRSRSRPPDRNGVQHLYAAPSRPPSPFSYKHTHAKKLLPKERLLSLTRRLNLTMVCTENVGQPP